MGREQWAEPQAEGRHIVLAELGHGGTADVYLAVARGPSGFRKLVVLKTLKTSLQSDPEFREMFLNEARLAARLNHPNIVQTYEVVEQNGVPTIVMEYLEGQPLSTILKRVPRQDFALAMHLRIICEVLAGLQYAHDLVDFDGAPLEVVHRDATPQNVFVTFDGHVKLLDFGIAKLSASSVETQQGIVKGKIRYIAPETILGQPVDRRADIYAVGVMLWEAAAGMPLWKDHTDAAIMSSVIRGAIPSPRTIRRDAHEGLERICMKALSLDPNARYGSALELESELAALVAELGGNVRHRDIGRMMSSAFQEVRLRTKAVIEQQLRTVGAFSTGDSQTRQVVHFDPQSARVQMGSGRPYFDVDIDESPPPSSQERLEAPSRSRFPLTVGLVAIGAAVLGWGAFWYLRGAASTSAESTGHPVVVTRAASHSDIKLRFRAHPAEARLYLDDKPLSSNPYSAILPADGAEHLLRAEAPGHDSAVRTVVFDRDMFVALTLEPLGAGASKPGAAAR